MVTHSEDLFARELKDRFIILYTVMEPVMEPEFQPRFVWVPVHIPSLYWLSSLCWAFSLQYCQGVQMKELDLMCPHFSTNSLLDIVWPMVSAIPTGSSLPSLLSPSVCVNPTLCGCILTYFCHEVSLILFWTSSFLTCIQHLNFLMERPHCPQVAFVSKYKFSEPAQTFWRSTLGARTQWCMW